MARNLLSSPLPFCKPMSESFDFVVIGGGSGGYAAARTAHELGMKTAVIDGAETLGGLCILRGCMPSKTLIESSNRFRSMRRGAEFGLHAENLSVDPRQIVARKKELIGEFAEYRQGQLEDERFELIRGTAAFSGSHTLEVSLLDSDETRTIDFRSAIIATGSIVTRIPLEGLEETGYWISDDVLDAEEIPDSIIVLGGGAIALEMACYLEGLGKEVTVIQRSQHVLTGSDKDVAEAVEEAISERDNLDLYTGTSLKRVYFDESRNQKAVVFDQGDAEKTVYADQILQALGRKPNSAPVKPENAGIEIDRGGKVSCQNTQETSVPHIYAAGDVCGPYEIVHIAIEQGEIAAHNAAVRLGYTTEEPKTIDYRLRLYGIFTDPQVGMVGMTEIEATEQGIPHAAASYPFDDHGKSMVMGETHGFVKMIAHRETGEILGAAVVGPEAVDLIHELVVAMHFRATTAEFLKIPHYHPTLSEIWSYPAEDLLFSD